MNLVPIRRAGRSYLECTTNLPVVPVDVVRPSASTRNRAWWAGSSRQTRRRAPKHPTWHPWASDGQSMAGAHATVRHALPYLIEVSAERGSLIGTGSPLSQADSSQLRVRPPASSGVHRVTPFKSQLLYQLSYAGAPVIVFAE